MHVCEYVCVCVCESEWVRDCDWGSICLSALHVCASKWRLVCVLACATVGVKLLELHLELRQMYTSVCDNHRHTCTASLVLAQIYMRTHKHTARPANHSALREFIPRLGALIVRFQPLKLRISSRVGVHHRGRMLEDRLVVRVYTDKSGTKLPHKVTSL